MKEVRIYHEVLEQALHFISPSITRAYPRLPITLVRLSKIKPRSSIIAETLADGLSIKDPDALITVIDDEGIEIPVLVIEFSTAVETQDHDLQRFDALMAAAKFNAPFVKIYAKRQTSSDFGGQLNYDRTATYCILTHRYRVPAFEVEWPLIDAYTASRDKMHRACPVPLQDFDNLVSVVLKLAESRLPISATLLSDGSGLCPELQRQLTAHNQAPRPGAVPPRSTRLYMDGTAVVLKFNRWGHAMDPERGMAWYYRELFGTPLVGVVKEKEATTTAEAFANLCRATGLGRGTSLSITDAQPFDISDAVSKSALNRAGLSVFFNCRRFKVLDSMDRVLVEVHWSTEPDLRKKIVTADLTALERRTKLTEDEVTYVAAYQVLRPNGFDILSVSYPGDQGDMAVVSGTGRKSKRRYIDIVAFKQNIALDITESKGEFNVDDINHAMDAILSMRDDPQLSALLRTVVATRAPLGTEPIVASIAFADSLITTRPKRLDELDFFISMTPTKWKIWSSDTDLDLQVRTGDTVLPETWFY